jgi:hypothetical protein
VVGRRLGRRPWPVARRAAYGAPVDDDSGLIGADPLVDGMRITLRLRRDMTVTDATAVLVAGRQAFLDLHPDIDAQTAELHVTCAADAVFALLERDGVMADHDEVGLVSDGFREQLTFNDPRPLPDPPHCCDNQVDYFALPPADLL